MALIGQNSILDNFPSSFDRTYARAGFSFSFCFWEKVKLGVVKGVLFFKGVWGNFLLGGKKGEKKENPFLFLLNFSVM